MLRHVLSSSSLLSVGYDIGTRVLEIEFWQGEVYRYFDVPHATYRGLMDASSPGQYFNEHIRHEFDSQRVD